MKIGLVGYKGSGKSTLFHWLTGVAPDPALARSGQSAMAVIADPRLEQLCRIYHPKKVTPATLEIVDTPGLSRDHHGNAQRLALIREADCLVVIVAAFDGSDPIADLRSFDEDLLLADIEVVSNRLDRIAEALKKPLPRHEHQQLEHEQAALKQILEAMEAGRPLRESQMKDEQRKATRAFRLLSEKPRLAMVNTADDESHAERFTALSTEELPILAAPLGLELELSRMSAEDRAEFEREMGLTATNRDHLIHLFLRVSSYMTFFTVSEKEVRAWLFRRGGTALDAAETIHSDMARGFIRAEVMTVADLVRLGSERELKAQHLLRQEPKDYLVQEDDILFIRFSV